MQANIRVLLVDDELDYVRSLAKVLGRRGMDVAVAEDGIEALEVLRGQEFDVVVLDMRMPRMGGVETLHEIRTTDPLTPVLILSGHTDLEDARRALNEGALTVLLKPCQVEGLVSAITDAAERKLLASRVPKGR